MQGNTNWDNCYLFNWKHADCIHAECIYSTEQNTTLNTQYAIQH